MTRKRLRRIRDADLYSDTRRSNPFRFLSPPRQLQHPNAPGETLDDVQRETDSFGVLSWVHTLNADAVMTTSVFAHYNAADLDASPADYPIATTDERASTYLGGQSVLRWHLARNDIQIGALGFSQHDTETFNILFSDGSGAPVHESSSPSGALEALYFEDTFRATDSLSVMAGVRQTHFSGGVVENATSPRIGATLVVPKIDWILRGYWGKFYQAPPLTTLQGPLLQFAQENNLGFLPLRGERDEEYQFGVTVPLRGWSIDIDHFRTQAKNFFDHDAIGNSNAFLPLTIDGAVISGNELSIRSPRFWNFGQAHVTYSNQVANGFGAVNGGLTDFSPPAGSFALDHDQRNTANVGVDANLPANSYISLNVYYGSGFANGDGTPSHLPSHAEINLSMGKTFAQGLSATLTVLNLTDKHLLTDNSLTFGGVHYNDPRQVIGEVHYRFGY